MINKNIIKCLLKAATAVSYQSNYININFIDNPNILKK